MFEKNENKQKEAGVGPFFKKNFLKIVSATVSLKRKSVYLHSHIKDMRLKIDLSRIEQKAVLSFFCAEETKLIQRSLLIKITST